MERFAERCSCEIPHAGQVSKYLTPSEKETAPCAASEVAALLDPGTATFHVIKGKGPHCHGLIVCCNFPGNQVGISHDE